MQKELCRRDIQDKLPYAVHPNTFIILLPNFVRLVVIEAIVVHSFHFNLSQLMHYRMKLRNFDSGRKTWMGITAMISFSLIIFFNYNKK